MAKATLKHAYSESDRVSSSEPRPQLDSQILDSADHSETATPERKEIEETGKVGGGNERGARQAEKDGNLSGAVIETINEEDEEVGRSSLKKRKRSAAIETRAGSAAVKVVDDLDQEARVQVQQLPAGKLKRPSSAIARDMSTSQSDDTAGKWNVFEFLDYKPKVKRVLVAWESCWIDADEYAGLRDDVAGIMHKDKKYELWYVCWKATWEPVAAIEENEELRKKLEVWLEEREL